MRNKKISQISQKNNKLIECIVYKAFANAKKLNK